MIHLLRKEIMSFYSTPFGFVFMGIFLLLSGLSFVTYNILGGGGDLAGMFSLLGNLSFMVFPVLTMRLFAEERRSGTEHLLISSRLTITQIVIAKYLAAVFVFLTSLIITFIYVAIIASYGYPDYGAIVASYLGYFMLGTAMISVCILASSIAENQVTAAIMSFGILFVLVMLGTLGRSITTPGISTGISALAITQRYDEFTLGVFQLGTVVYYLAYSAVALLLTVKNLEWRRLR